MRKSHEPSTLEIRPSRIHRRGLFACQDLDAGSLLIEYVGIRISKMKAAELSLKQNSYIFTLNKDADLDGNVSWNPARFINHSCEPNCKAQQDHQDRIWIVSTRQIRRGEELTFNYGYDLKNFRKHPCGCGAPACLGYMVAEDLFPALRLLLLSISPDLERA